MSSRRELFQRPMGLPSRLAVAFSVFLIFLKAGIAALPSDGCLQCHGTPSSVEIEEGLKVSKLKLEIERFDDSVHGIFDCVDCHLDIAKLEHTSKLAPVNCAECHEDVQKNYASSIHGAHDVQPASHPSSKLSQANIVNTCAKCHPGSNAGFTGYLPHANPLDAENYPTLFFVFISMTALLAGVFLVFGVHTLAWFYRALRLFISDSKTFRQARLRAKEEKEWFTRFTPFERFLHMLVVTSFLLLVFTGMPLKFYYADWAKVLLDMIGGVEVARSLHHFGALVTFLYFALHLGSLAGKIWRWLLRNYQNRDENGRRKIPWKKAWGAIFGPDSMVPSMADWRDLVAHLKWFAGRGPQPQFDRWTYWEKFDYFSVFWGIAIIGLSGLILWFPQFFTTFMPGWWINVALIVHSDEALLAAGFIFTFHFFNTHFRIEKFPMDTVIFSGRIPKVEMLHERKRWYDRLVAEGRLDDFRVKDEWERWKTIARAFGYLFFGLGLILLFLIIYALALHFTN